MTATDLRGVPIHQGDIVAYPSRHRSDLWLNVGVVVRIERGAEEWSGQSFPVIVVRVTHGRKGFTDRRATTFRLDKVVVECRAVA